MEVDKNTDTAVNNKMPSVRIIKKCIIEPVQQMFADSSSSNDVSFEHISEVHVYLQQSKRKFDSLNEVLLSNRCANRNIEIEVQQLVADLKKNITLLEGKMETYKKSVEEENNKIEISKIEKYFEQPDLFKSLARKILRVYEEPLYNAHYGKVIRNILIDLGELEDLKDSKKLNKFVIQCETILEQVKERAKVIDEFDELQIEKVDAMNLQASFESLLEMFRVLMSNTDRSKK